MNEELPKHNSLPLYSNGNQSVFKKTMSESSISKLKKSLEWRKKEQKKEFTNNPLHIEVIEALSNLKKITKKPIVKQIKERQPKMLKNLHSEKEDNKTDFNGMILSQDFSRYDLKNLKTKTCTALGNALQEIRTCMPNKARFTSIGGLVFLVAGTGIGMTTGGTLMQGLGVVPGLFIGGGIGLFVGLTGGITIDMLIAANQRLNAFIHEQQELSSSKLDLKASINQFNSKIINL